MEIQEPIATLADRVRAGRLPDPDTRRAIRERAGVSLREVARVLDVDAMTVHRWEQGTTLPNRHNAIAYRQVLDALEQAVTEP
jgi:DNA-binding transcriptional regulator YiaG